MKTLIKYLLIVSLTVAATVLAFGVFDLCHALEFTPTWPWVMFHDYSSYIYTTGYTAAQQQQIADLGAGMWDIKYIYTPNGQSELAAIKALNPNFLVFAYYAHTHIPVADVSTSFPFWDTYDSILDGEEAKTTDGSCVPAWPGPPDAVSMNWQGLLPATGSKTYDEDTMIEIIRLWEDYSLSQAVVPDGVQLDYIYDRDKGFYEWPDDITANGELDMDQDGTTYDAPDSQEIQAFEDFQTDFVDSLHAVMGDSFIIVANGSGAYEDNGWPNLAGRLDGQLYELFPDLASLAIDARETIDMVHDGYTNWYGEARSMTWSLLFLAPGTPLNTTDPLSDAMAARVGSMIWQTPWAVVYDPGTGHVYEDPQQSYFAGAGQPTGSITKTLPGDGSVEYSRAFDGGTARYIVEADNTTVTATWEPTPATNGAAIAANDFYTIEAGGTLSVSAPGPLANDQDPEDDALTLETAILGPYHASSFTLNSDGSFTYENDGNSTYWSSLQAAGISPFEGDIIQTFTRDAGSGGGSFSFIAITVTPTDTTTPPDVVPQAPSEVTVDEGVRRYEWYNVDPADAPTFEFTVEQVSHMYLYIRGEAASGGVMNTWWRPSGRPTTDRTRLEFLTSDDAAGTAPHTDLKGNVAPTVGRYSFAATNAGVPAFVMPGEVQIEMTTTGGGPWAVVTVVLVPLGP